MGNSSSLRRTLKKVAVVCIAAAIPVAGTAAPAHAKGGLAYGDSDTFVQCPSSTRWNQPREVKQFIVKFNALVGQTDRSNAELLNEITSRYGSTASKVREGQDGAWIVRLEPAIAADDAVQFRADLESKAQILWAHEDRMMVPF